MTFVSGCSGAQNDRSRYSVHAGPTSRASAVISSCCGRARATVARRLCTIACFYRYAEEEGLISISPAVHVRRPRLDYESHATGLGPQRGRGHARGRRAWRPQDHTLLSLLALNGLRVSEAIGVNIERLGLERGHPPDDRA